MILLAVGSNLPSHAGAPLATCQAALRELAARGVAVHATSTWYESAPVPASDQPWFVNGVVRVDTALPPAELLPLMHAIEKEFARERAAPNAARTLDLDLLAYGDHVLGTGPLMLPHPRLHERAFVLYPLKDVAPDWLHPVRRQTPAQMIAALGQTLENQGIRPLSVGP
jgi:2-amino-4-hydroxy-6-hydroxymethyldihydropteridine diphosphokinase